MEMHGDEKLKIQGSGSLGRVGDEIGGLPNRSAVLIILNWVSRREEFLRVSLYFSNMVHNNCLKGLC